MPNIPIIEQFVQATNGAPSPERFRRWAGITLVSSLLSRRCYTELIGGRKLFPNIFVGLVGRPGMGKNEAIMPMRKVLKEFSDTELSPHKITPAAFLKKLGEVFPDMSTENDETKILAKSYAIAVSEIGAFLPRPDIEFMQILADLWSGSVEDFTNETKWKGIDRSFDQYVTMIAGIQPGWLNAVMSPSVLQLGLPSRFFWILEKEKPVLKFFSNSTVDKDVKALAAKLTDITSFRGFVKFSNSAITEFTKWDVAGRPTGANLPFVFNTLTEDYASRRHEHVGRLAVIFAASNHPTIPRVELSDLQQALETLWDAEKDLEEVFSYISANPYRMHERVTLEFVEKYCASYGHVTEGKVRDELGKQVPSHLVELVLNGMIGSGLLKDISGHLTPLRLFTPGVEA